MQCVMAVHSLSKKPRDCTAWAAISSITKYLLDTLKILIGEQSEFKSIFTLFYKFMMASIVLPSYLNRLNETLQTTIKSVLFRVPSQ